MRWFRWRGQDTLDLHSLYIAAVVAECGGRDAWAPICSNHVGRRLGINGKSVSRRLRGMVHAGVLRAKPLPPHGHVTGYLITDRGLARLSDAAHPLMQLVLPPFRGERHATEL